MINRNEWKCWNELPKPKEGGTFKYRIYQDKMFETIQKLKPKNILEIGFNAGHSACCFLNASPESTLYTFDICKHGTENEAYKILNKQFDIKLTEGDSVETIPRFINEYPDLMFDFIFIDGGHSNDTPYYDIINTKTKLNKNGYMLIDDMNIPSVVNCVNKSNITNEFKVIPFRSDKPAVLLQNI
jgi:predicted O-methyltransferase YrrM